MNRIRPIIRKQLSSSQNDKNRLYDQKLSTIQESLCRLTQCINHLANFQVKNQSINTQSALNSIITDSDTRFRYVKIHVPRISIDEQKRRLQVRKFMGGLCKQVFEHAFDQLLYKKLQNDQVKVYCSENILYWIVQFIKINSLSQKQIQIINRCLKQQILPYFAQKYPLSDGDSGNTAFQKIIIPHNNIDDELNDLVARSGVKFRVKSSGNYNAQIMKFFNYLINLSASSEKFYQTTMQGIFERIFTEDKLHQMQMINLQDLRNSELSEQNAKKPSMKKIQQQGEQTINNSAPNKIDAEYKQKVKNYTDYRIGKKLPSNIKQFTKKQIASGEIKLDNPALTRILTKWCEQLQKCFVPENIINRQKPFKMLDGSFDFLENQSLNKLLSLFLQQQSKQIQIYKKKIMNHSDKMQKFFSEQDNSQYDLYSSEQASVGCFAVAIEKINESYLIGYINKLMHGILRATGCYASCARSHIYEPYHLYTCYNKVIDRIYERLDNHEDLFLNYEQKTPDLITFKVGDLLRSKCSSKERQIIALYKYLEKLSINYPQKLKIIRVKNRLSKGTKDILINMRVNNCYLAEVQLAITTGKSKFIKNSNYFSHYLYELQRAQFGPINEMCNIWVNKDNRSKIYRTIFEGRMYNRKQIKDKCPECQHKFVKKQHQLPFLCTFCDYFFSGSQNQETFEECNLCLQKKCIMCQMDIDKQKQLVQDLPYKNKSQEDMDQNNTRGQQLLKRIPEQGKFRRKVQPDRQPLNFIKAQTSSKIYLLQEISDGNYQSIIEINKNISPNKFISNNQAKQNYNHLLKFLTQSMLQQVKTEQQLSKQMRKKIKQNYLVPKYLLDSHISEKNSINLINQAISEKAFYKFQQVLKKYNKKKINVQKNKSNEIRYVKKMNVSENSLHQIQCLVQYTDLEQLIANQNRIQKLPINNWKNLKIIKLSQNLFSHFDAQVLIHKQGEEGEKSYVKQLNLNNNGLQTLSDNFGKLILLQKLYMTCNLIKSLPENLQNMTNLQILQIQQNQISDLPSNFGKLINLEILNARSNQIQNLPNTFGNLQSLQTLQLSFNQLKCLPQNFGNLKKLRILQLQHNEINTLPCNFGDMTDLIKIDLFYNKLTKLPESFSKLTNLTTVGMGLNMLSQLPNDFGNLKQLKYLNFEQNKLSQLPDSFGELSSLKNLSVQNNELNSLPATFGNLKSLQIFQAFNNKLQCLPNNFGKLQSLRQLKLNSNQLSKLSDDFGQLKNLSFLNLSKNRLNQIPINFGKLTKLTALFMEGNQIKNLPDNFESLVDLSYLCLQFNKIEYLPESIGQLKKLKQLTIHCNKLRNLPESFGDLQKLEHLNIQKNGLTNLPKNFGKLKSLLKLDIKNNQLTQLPDNFGQLLSLSQLKIYNNQLRSLPHNFGQLQNLKKLLINRNNLEYLPDTFGQLKSLNYLEIHQNQLVSLPTNFGNLQKLTILNLRDNHLKRLPDSFGQLKQLQIAYIYNNQIQQLPATFNNLQKLIKLYINGNKISKLDSNFEGLKALNILNIGVNKFTQVPNVIYKLPKLLELRVSKNFKQQLRQQKFSSETKIKYS